MKWEFLVPNLPVRRGLVLLVLLPVAAGCGAKESGLAESEKAMERAGSSRVEMTMKSGEGPIFSGTGSIDYTNNRGEFVFTSKDMPGGEMRARFIGRTSYFGLTLLGKLRWQKQTDDYTPTGVDRFTPGPDGPNPDQILGMLMKASKRVETVGNEEIRGISTRHYRAHLDKEKLGETWLREEIVIEAWIDEEDLVRRLRVPYAEETTVFDFFDFGLKVDVEAPPADEILSDEEFTRLLEKECAQMHTEPGESDICAMTLGSGSGSYESEVEPVPAPEVGK
jgi:hypothetical protein